MWRHDIDLGEKDQMLSASTRHSKTSARGWQVVLNYLHHGRGNKICAQDIDRSTKYDPGTSQVALQPGILFEVQTK
jgi:hypothetical protein